MSFWFLENKTTMWTEKFEYMFLYIYIHIVHSKLYIAHQTCVQAKINYRIKMAHLSASSVKDLHLFSFWLKLHRKVFAQLFLFILIPSNLCVPGEGIEFFQNVRKLWKCFVKQVFMKVMQMKIYDHIVVFIWNKTYRLLVVLQ